MVYFFIFSLGAIFGSFFNVLILRKNTGESAVASKSRCFSCGHGLAAADLIPILSFIFLNGRCRYCGSRISLQYPVVEILAGFLALAIFGRIDSSEFFAPAFLWYFACFSALFLVAIYDFRTKIIDRSFLRILGIFSAVEFARRNFAESFWLTDLVSSFVIALFFYLMWRFSGGRWMGRGDADLAFFASLLIGFPLNLAGFIFAFWIGGAVGILLILFFKKFGPKSEIPFGPFLAAGAFLAWYFAEAAGAVYGII